MNDIQTAMPIVNELENKFSDWAFAIGGSVARVGVSGNDIDIFATNTTRLEEFAPVREYLQETGWSLIDSTGSLAYNTRTEVFYDGSTTLHFIIILRR